MFELISGISHRTHQVMVGNKPDMLSDPQLRSVEGMAAADRAASEINLSYTRDRMWRDEAESGPYRAGMRMPPTADFASGEGASRPWASVYDGFNWTLILTVPDRTAVRTAYIRQLDLAALVWLNARVRLVLAVGDAFAWNAPRPTLYVVRPDGYIAFRCDAAAGQLPDVNRLSAWLIENFAGSLRTDSVAP
jgi:hypothetical protein